MSPSSVFQISIDKVPQFLNQEFANVNIFDRNKAFDNLETGQTEPLVANSIFNPKFQSSEVLE